MLSCCTRRISPAAHVQGLSGARIEDTTYQCTHGCSALEGVEARGIGIELVDSRHLQLVGKKEEPGAVGEVVDEQTVVVARIGEQQGHDQSSPNGLLEGEEHVLEGAKENIAGIVVDGLRVVDQHRDSDHQGYRYKSVL
jgi:hypothetical protein